MSKVHKIWIPPNILLTQQPAMSRSMLAAASPPQEKPSAAVCGGTAQRSTKHCHCSSDSKHLPKTLHYTIRKGWKSTTSEFAQGSWGPAQTPNLLTVLHAALCGAGRCAMLRAVQRWAQCGAGRSGALRAVQRWAQCSAARCICAVLKANASAQTFGSVSSCCCTGSASLNAAQYPRLPLRSASPAEGLLPRAPSAVKCTLGAV